MSSYQSPSGSGSHGPSPANDDNALDTSFPDIYPYRHLVTGQAAQTWAHHQRVDAGNEDAYGGATTAGHLNASTLSNSGWMIPAETMLHQAQDTYEPEEDDGDYGDSPRGSGSVARHQQQDYEGEYQGEDGDGATPASTSAQAGPGPSTAAANSSRHAARSLTMLAQPPPQPRTLDELLIQFWTRQMDLAESGGVNDENNADGDNGDGDAREGSQAAAGDEFKTFNLPLARIKKVMKSDPDVKMISAEAPVLLSKTCEIFIAELTCRAWLVAESFKRRTLQKSDVAAAIGYSDMFDFLIDIVPREEAVSKSELGHRKRNAKSKEKRDKERQAKRQRMNGGEEDEGGDDGSEQVDEGGEQ